MVEKNIDRKPYRPSSPAAASYMRGTDNIQQRILDIEHAQRRNEIYADTMRKAGVLGISTDSNTVAVAGGGGDRTWMNGKQLDATRALLVEIERKRLIAAVIDPQHPDLQRDSKRRLRSLTAREAKRGEQQLASTQAGAVGEAENIFAQQREVAEATERERQENEANIQFRQQYLDTDTF